ncbi:hypothetical protein CPARA_3gp465 (nucleomorph) [Cryptomonas paramecium]|uniref:Uncharacterized protein n=1 Tax=Cryptomonas paramaecium TaxID=2898 RepID=F2HI60_9CRYP|nr:hypothetical protein CPARA_3gp465 [Cryptomonas paramecium]AEA39123.1 hypothetical protein CPARA_3gp465 [Cryptomonas paramecium]|mmetsp:Transcript_58655/g.155108  ORF Transcript_58655/g.155108 Transcript_58655/m.155108 type:complete len:381 (+) Transcript_58655:448-1590(+)
MSYKRLYSFLKQKFWFEFDVLNQKFINLSKNTFSLTISKLKNYKIYSKKTLICYYHLFSKFLSRTNCHKIIYLFLVSICRFELIYIEDKLIFLETYFKTRKKFFKTREVLPVFIELLSCKFFIPCKKKNRILYQMFTFLIHFIIKIKNNRIENGQFQMIYKKALYKLQDNIIFDSNFCDFNLIHKLYNHIGKILNKNKADRASESNLHQQKSLHWLYSYDFLLIFLLNSNFNIEKKNWFNIKNTSRSKRPKGKFSFFEKIQSYNYTNYIRSFYCAKRIQSNEFNYLFIERILKKQHRSSCVSRFKEFFLKELSLILDKFLLKYKIKKKINTEKQLLKPVKNKFLFVLYPFVNKISKNKKIASIYDYFLMFIHLIKRKSKY